MMRLRILPEAEEELSEAARWYESRRSGLGVEPVMMVERALDEIREAPVARPLWQPGRPYRKFVMRRFPYVVMYTARDDEVEVVAIAHAKRRPGYWLDRK